MNDDEKGNRGLLARFLPNVKPPPGFTGPDPLELDPNGWKKAADPVANPEAAAEYRAAEALFQQGNFAEAETAFQKATRKRKDTPWGEKAQYYLAECQFQRNHYFDAHDSYEKLLADYPGTDYLEKAVKREYTIADIWLQSFDSKAPPEAKEKWGDRFNGRLPLMGVEDNAMKALEHVRHHDPTGPLADVAVMRIADHYYEQGSWELASIYYDQLISDHPKSKLVPKARLASIDAKVKDYLGPDYDGAGLTQAKTLIKQELDASVERTAGTNETLYKTVDMIHQEEAKRSYMVGEHYLWTGHIAGAEYYFGQVPAKWPKSPYAAKAKEQLAKIAKMPRKETLPSKIMSRPGSSDPFASGVTSGNPGGMTGAGNMGGGTGP